MRLWHYKLIPYLPNSQLIAQWRELNSIFAKQPNHILINYVYEYPKEDLELYSLMILNEIVKRKIKINKPIKFLEYFHYLNEPDILGFRVKNVYFLLGNQKIFENHHTDRYLWQCFANLSEKYDRGQKDFDEKTYERLEMFMQEQGVATII